MSISVLPRHHLSPNSNFQHKEVDYSHVFLPTLFLVVFTSLAWCHLCLPDLSPSARLIVISLGNNGTAQVNAPPAVPILSSVQSVACGLFGTCALMTWGGVRCWGRSDILGLGLILSQRGPVHTPPTSDVITGVSSVVVGTFHVCVLMSGDGGVRCWVRALPCDVALFFLPICGQPISVDFVC